MWFRAYKSMQLGKWDQTCPLSSKKPSLTFTPPGQLKQLDFRGPEFFLAVGRGVARQPAPMHLLVSQTISSFVSLSTFMKPVGCDMSLSSGIALLNELKAATAAHDLGVATAYMFASRLGLTWSALAEDLISVTGPPHFQNRKCPDMLFERGDGSGVLVAVEAKGRTRKDSKGAQTRFHKELKDSCHEQVGNVIGHKTIIGEIALGYAVGAWVPRGGPAGTFHVCETDFTLQAGTPIRGSPSQPPEDIVPKPRAITAAHTYLTGARLVGDLETRGILDAWLINLRQQLDLKKEKETVETPDIAEIFSPGIATYRGRKYKIGLPIPVRSVDTELNGDFHFGFDLESANKLLDALKNQHDVESPIIEFGSLGAQSRSDHLSFVDRSGLAILYSEEIEMVRNPQVG